MAGGSTLARNLTKRVTKSLRRFGKSFFTFSLSRPMLNLFLFIQQLATYMKKERF